MVVVLVVVATVLVVVGPKGSQGFPEFSESPLEIPLTLPEAPQGFT